MNIEQLNDLLGREMGRSASGDPTYKWEWSEDLFWPAYDTGRQVERTSPGGLIYFEKEYQRDRMSHKLRNQWVVTKLCKPEELPRWKEMFPGADYPGTGYRVNTDWYNEPGVEPSLEDTRCLIYALRQQLSKNFATLMDEQQSEADDREKSQENEVQDEIRDSFPAFLNPNPGTRGNFVSFPYSNKERKEAVPNG